ncbi:unnamed protein product [Symbiodinium sp. CCMP2592]|nr:unnamed protein product [Symbiodinium sp. CCMP2592]
MEFSSVWVVRGAQRKKLTCTKVEASSRPVTWCPLLCAILCSLLCITRFLRSEHYVEFSGLKLKVQIVEDLYKLEWICQHLSTAAFGGSCGLRFRGEAFSALGLEISNGGHVAAETSTFLQRTLWGGPPGCESSAESLRQHQKLSSEKAEVVKGACASPSNPCRSCWEILPPEAARKWRSTRIYESGKLCEFSEMLLNAPAGIAESSTSTNDFKNSAAC